MVLTNISEKLVDPDLHSGSRRLATKGSVTIPPVDILANLQHLYGKPSYQDLNAAFLRLKNPMNRMQPVEVRLRGIVGLP